MKYKMIIKANQEEMFDAFSENFRNEFFMEKGKILPEEKIQKGFTFQKNVSKDKRKQQARFATVKVLMFDKPNKYRVEYTSDRYHKITGIELKQLDEKKLEIIVEEVLDKIVNNNGKMEYVSEIKESNEVKRASLWLKFQYKYLARSIRLRKEKNSQK